jgi:phage baseplate assembly protein W
MRALRDEVARLRAIALAAHELRVELDTGRPRQSTAKKLDDALMAWRQNGGTIRSSFNTSSTLDGVGR